jgi:hypothetical protein
MGARMNVDDYVNLVVLIYEKHFNDAEINELIQVQRDVKDSKTPHLSPHLQEKLSADSITVQSEILGGCAQIGAKIGGEIAQEIAKEHPDWVPTATPQK